LQQRAFALKGEVCVVLRKKCRRSLLKIHDFFMHARTVHVCKFTVKLCPDFYNHLITQISWNQLSNN